MSASEWVSAPATTPVKWSPTRSYFGAEMAERMLVPLGDAKLGEIRFEDWLRQSAIPAVPA